MVYTQSIQLIQRLMVQRRNICAKSCSVFYDKHTIPVSELFYTLGTNDSVNSQSLDLEIQFRLKLTQRAFCSFGLRGKISDVFKCIIIQHALFG